MTTLHVSRAVPPRPAEAKPPRLHGALLRIERKLQPWRAPLGWIAFAGVLGWLLLQLRAIGWSSLRAALPTSPTFYALVVAAYLVLPLADTAIYRGLWRTRAVATFRICLRKRIYNSVLIGYSGEVALLLWARERVGRSAAELAHAIKDVNVLSAAVSTYGAAALICWLATRVALDRLPDAALIWWGAATIALAAVSPLLFIRRGGVLAMPLREGAPVLAVHAVRFVLGLLLVLAQWRVALPGTGWTALVALLAVQVLVGRLPLVPNRDVLFAGVALSMSGTLAMKEASLAGVLVVTSVLQQALHLLTFAATEAAGATPR